MMPTTPTPACDQVEMDLSAFADGTLDTARRAEVEAHVRACAACAGLVRDLRQIRTAAGALGSPAPPAHVWLEVAGQIRLSGGVTSPADAALRPSRSRAARWQWIGIAAALVITTLGLYVVTTRSPQPGRTSASAPAGNAKTSVTVESVQDDLRQAEALYTGAIAKLEAIAKSDSGAITPDVAAKLQRSLTTIDTAIAESRSALNEHPESTSARDSLFEALRQKVAVLQQTVALINVMRNGDQSGAAKIVGGKSSS
jgi:anti-sigma factor RsiW